MQTKTRETEDILAENKRLKDSIEVERNLNEKLKMELTELHENLSARDVKVMFYFIVLTIQLE